jgi:hypothetical protein
LFCHFFPRLATIGGQKVPSVRTLLFASFHKSSEILSFVGRLIEILRRFIPQSNGLLIGLLGFSLACKLIETQSDFFRTVFVGLKK